MNYESALEYIHAVQWAGHKPGLSRTRTLLAALGDSPQEAPLRPCGGYQRQGQHCRHAGVLPAGGGV